jgi:hypothetical protein
MSMSSPSTEGESLPGYVRLALSNLTVAMESQPSFTGRNVPDDPL